MMMQRGSRHCRHLTHFVTWIVVTGLPLWAVRAFTQNYQVDASSSQALTAYLREHRLPLVGAQVLTDNTGERRIVLYGFVATDFGKNDAARKALDYINKEAQSSAAQVENRIEVRPDIARMSSHTNTAGESAGAKAGNAGKESLDDILNDIDRYGVNVPAGEATVP
jgi:hypothetical protein